MTAPLMGMETGGANFIGGDNTGRGTAITGAAPFFTPGAPDCDGKITGRLGDTLDRVTAGSTFFSGTTGSTSLAGVAGSLSCVIADRSGNVAVTVNAGCLIATSFLGA